MRMSHGTKHLLPLYQQRHWLSVGPRRGSFGQPLWPEGGLRRGRLSSAPLFHVRRGRGGGGGGRCVLSPLLCSWPACSMTGTGAAYTVIWTHTPGWGSAGVHKAFWANLLSSEKNSRSTALRGCWAASGEGRLPRLRRAGVHGERTQGFDTVNQSAQGREGRAPPSPTAGELARGLPPRHWSLR